MAFRSFGKGSVLRDTQVSPTNSPTTGATQTGVVRDARPVPAVYTTQADAPDFVDAAADQYIAAVVEAPGTTATEYIVWAANTANLAGPVDDDPTWWTEAGTGAIPTGTTTVGTFMDGSTTAIVTDSGNRDIGRIYAIVVARGDVDDYDDNGWKNPNDTNPASYPPGNQPRKGVNPYLTLYFNTSEQDPRLGMVYLTPAHLTALGGGLSNDRGDKIITVHYTVSSARFWWTKNDRYETRFGWDNATQKWAPYKGTVPLNLGVLDAGTVYHLVPAIKNLPVGSFLPGTSTVDAYAMIRVGTGPGALESVPVTGIEVRPDDEIQSGSPIAGNGRMGQSNGLLEINPTFINANLGKTLWYVPNTFLSTNTGVIGKMVEGPLYVAPIPSLSETPLIRFGSRQPLSATVVENDATLLAAAEPQNGHVLVSESTGLLRFNGNDLAQADPQSPLFNKLFLGEQVVYDGVSLSGKEQPTRKPVQLVDNTGTPTVASSPTLFIPDYEYLPTEFTSADTRRGLGMSGILDAPDNTGAVPTGVGVDAALRPNGDNTAGTTTGRVRQVSDGISDTILFTHLGAIETLVIVDKVSDFPFHYDIPSGTAYIARERSAHGSAVRLSYADMVKWAGVPIFFLQSALTPATWTNKARLVSRNRNIFRFTGTEQMRFAIDGVAHTWSSAALVSANPTKTFFTAAEVATSFGLPNNVFVSAERIVIQATDPDTGTVEIGFGIGGDLDLSGCKALGFVPGWCVKGGVDNWVPDSGVSLGMHRTPVDLSATEGTPDFKATERLLDFTLTESITAIPFYYLNTVPLLDKPGYDKGVFFNLTATVTDGDTTQIINTPLAHYKDIIYRFNQKKFDWVEENTVENVVATATNILNFGVVGIAPESFEPVVGGGMYVAKDGGAATLLTRDEDYLVLQGGTPGNAALIERFLSRKAYGARGTLVAGTPTFTAADVDFVSLGAKEGDLLSTSQGVFTVTAVNSATNLSINPAADTTGQVVWELLNGYPSSVYDPALVADMTYTEFNHLPDETMVARMLTPVPASRKVNLSAALASNRKISLRFGSAPATATNTETLTALTQTDLGILANGLKITATADPHFTSGAFAIRIGATATYMPVGVTTFSPNPATVEYITSGTDVGTLKFNTSILSTLSNARVYYAQDFLDPASLAAGTAEYDPITGIVNPATADVVANAGKVLYFVEQLVTENRKDVAINPILGSFSLNTPATKGVLIETAYWQADLEGRKIGDQIVELLPVFVRNEVATRVATNKYTFNTNKAHAIDQAVEPIVYIGPMRQNYGRLDFVVDYPARGADVGKGVITFLSHTVPDNVDVKVTYAVYDMQGGERAFEVSTKPVYRPPFFIKASQDRFGLRGDRTADYVPGQLIRIGEDCFYVKSLKYYPQNATNTGDVTAVYIFPSTINEVGSRSPGNDILTVVSGRPITTVVDPDGTPVTTTAASGYMIPLVGVQFDPVVQGQKSVVFYGDLTQFAVAGHILEIGGVPYTIAAVDRDATGTRTKIAVTSIFRFTVTAEENPTVKLSVRPLYPPAATEFLGVGAVLQDEPHTLFLVDSAAPGKALVENVDYSIDPTNGNIQYPAGLGVTQDLFLKYTRLDTLAPYMINGVMGYPRYTASFLSQLMPSQSNGILGGQLKATYTYAWPDTFYFRAVPLTNFLSEVVQEITTEIATQRPANGAPNFTGSGTKNWQYGTYDLYGERRHLTDKDRVARTYLEFYNNAIATFEQIPETVTGGFVGDRDGKFRFTIWHDQQWTGPGGEDTITGNLIPHNVWTDVVNQMNPSAKFFGLESDPLVAPGNIQVVNGVVEGDFLWSSNFESMRSHQKALVYNDVDDRVVVQASDPVWGFDANGHFQVALHGNYKSMWDTHQLSRLFPTVTHTFFRTFPGVNSDLANGDPGVYGSTIPVVNPITKETTTVSTTNSPIGQLHNLPVGDITNISVSLLRKRRARARIWGFYPYGLPANVLGSNAAITGPCVIAFPDMLGDVAVDPTTGYPISSQFVSQGGTLPDLTLGDAVMTLPGFAAGDQIALGKPDGTAYAAYDHSNPVLVSLSYAGVFVHEVLYGCVLTFQSSTGLQILDPVFLFAEDTPFQSILERGDTIIVTAPMDSLTADPPDPPENSTFALFVQASDYYKDGSDLKVLPDGQVLDLTQMVITQTVTGQKPPLPLSPIEGTVYFAFNGQNPLKIPALQGLYLDDSGDNQMPYVLAKNTELDRFGQASVAFSKVFAADPLNHAVYPDEVVGNDGVLTNAMLQTAQVTSPGFGPGKGNVQAFDLLLTQVEVPNPFSTPGPLGIHSVGSVDSGSPSLIEPPRFVTPTKPPSAGSTTTESMTYIAENAMVFVEGPYPTNPQAGPPPDGVYIIEDTVAGVTILDFGTTGIALNNGITVGTGNLNDLCAAGVDITIRLIARQDADVLHGPAMPLPNAAPGGVVALTIKILAGIVTVTDYSGAVIGPLAGGLPVFGTHVPPLPMILDNRQIHIPQLGLIPWGPGPGTRPQWFLPHTLAGGIYTTLYGFECSVSIDAETAGASTTAWIGNDRLTFYETYDLSFAKKRGYTHPQSGIDLATKLSVYNVTVGLDTATNGLSKVNRYGNGMLNPVDPIPYTFVPRTTGSDVVGYWTQRLGGTTERGRIKVMGFEGPNNGSISGANITFSAIPSNDRYEGGVILSGTGKTASKYTALTSYTTERFDHRITEITTTAGNQANVQAGDVLVISQSSNPNHPGTEQAGTYLVRHVVPTVAPGDVVRKVSPATLAGNETGWCPLHFPTVVSFDSATNKLVLSDLAPTEGGPTYGGNPSGWATPGASTRVYVIRDLAGVASTDSATFAYSVVSARYTAITGSAEFTLTDYRDALGNPITAATFDTLLDAEYQVSGMAYWPVNVGGKQYGLPDNNTVGFDSESDVPVPVLPWADWAVYGFHLVSFVPQGVFSTATTLSWTGDRVAAPAPYILKATGTANCIVPIPGTVANDYQFQADPTKAVYPWVVRTLCVADITAAAWKSLNITPTSAGAGGATVNCILPGTKLSLSSGGNAGFYAQTGIFLEPTFPRSAVSLASGHPCIVDATHSLPNPAPLNDWEREVGMRNSQVYSLWTNPNGVSFSVRRIRRWHEVLDGIDQNLMPLRFAYEIRRGVVTGYTTNNKQQGVLDATAFVWTDGLTYTGTQLGVFNDPDVNIHSGDILRLLDSDGEVLEEIRIAGVSDADTLILDAPGLQTSVVVGKQFQVFLKQVPVPHEQTNEQLLDILTVKKVHRTIADWTQQKGGYVPDLTTGTPYIQAVNKLYDDLNATVSGQFGALGIKKGDIVIIDPAGDVPQVGGLPLPQERGVRPLGDKGVASRVASFLAGRPSPVDDNRGYYRITKVYDTANPPYLAVEPTNTYAGTESAPVTFGTGNYAYAVYPTVTDSPLKQAPYPDPGAGNRKEAQMALRPTLKRDGVTQSFITRTDGWDGHSLRPFGYRVIRPSKLFSDEAVDLVLSTRERILSLIEVLRQASLGKKHGSYFIFQRDEHIKELGNTTDPDLGLGVPSNVFIEGLMGRTDIVPYANNSACLSLLDRRVWIHDRRLDALTANPTGGMKVKGVGDTAYTDYTGTTGSSVLPGLLERVSVVLDKQDKFRDLRYVWLSYRTHKVLGTLTAIRRFDANLEQRLKDQNARIAALKAALKTTEGTE